MGKGKTSAPKKKSAASKKTVKKSQPTAAKVKLAKKRALALYKSL